MKEPSEKSCEYQTKIWNEQVIMQKNFPNEFKLADITPILKKRRFYAREKLVYFFVLQKFLKE